MRWKLVVFSGWLAAVIGAAPVSAQLRKVRFSVSAASIAEVPFRIANIKGFYRDEGLDVEVILIRGAVGMQALLGGSVDYTSASGSTIAAAVRGIPVKLVFIASAKPQFDLIAQPSIRSIADLKGKNIGISSRGGAIDLLSQLILQKNGLAPNKDLISLVVGGQEDTVLALRAGRIAAGSNVRLAPDGACRRRPTESELDQRRPRLHPLEPGAQRADHRRAGFRFQFR